MWPALGLTRDSMYLRAFSATGSWGVTRPDLSRPVRAMPVTPGLLVSLQLPLLAWLLFRKSTALSAMRSQSLGSGPGAFLGSAAPPLKTKTAARAGAKTGPRVRRVFIASSPRLGARGRSATTPAGRANRVPGANRPFSPPFGGKGRVRSVNRAPVPAKACAAAGPGYCRPGEGVVKGPVRKGPRGPQLPKVRLGGRVSPAIHRRADGSG